MATRALMRPILSVRLDPSGTVFILHRCIKLHCWGAVVHPNLIGYLWVELPLLIWRVNLPQDSLLPVHD